MSRSMRKHFALAAILAAALVCVPTPAHAVSKEIIQLQVEVQQLLNSVQQIQSTLDSRFSVLQNVVQQTATQVNQMNATVTSLQQKINAQDQAASSQVNTISGQIQSMNDSVDELRTRVEKLQNTVQKLQSQIQNMQAPPLTGMPGETPGGSASAMPAGQPGSSGAGTPAGQPGSTGAAEQMPTGAPPTGPQALQEPTGAAPSSIPTAAQAPPLKQTYERALGDFHAGRYKLAGSEFHSIIRYYPYDGLAGNAQFYIGEIAYRQHRYSDAVKAYTTMLEVFPGSSLAATAELHKAYALLNLKKQQAGINELRLLIRRYPQTPAAAQARQKLDGMGVRIVPR